MGAVLIDLTMSLDGFVAGSDDGPARRTRTTAGPRRKVSVVPLLLACGVRLFEHLGLDPVNLEQVRVVESDGVTHLRYRVVR